MTTTLALLAAVQMTSAEVAWKIATALGALGMFLYGMSLMSGGLQKMAGDSLRVFIGKMTSNKFMGVLVGIGVTALVQSSTATTLLLVSFVNAGLMALSNAIGVIMGANIGTTVTAWIFALGMSGGSGFSIGAIAVPIMFIGFVLRSIKNNQCRNFGEFLFGFGFLFLGLSTLTANMRPLLDTEAMRTFLGSIAGAGFWSILLFMVAGACLTLMMQSSAATMSITMALAMSGAIPFTIASAMVLGENIGTTITSNIAAASANVSAKRTARAHMLFNLFGVVWVLCLYKPFLRLIGIIAAALFPATFVGADLSNPEYLLTQEQGQMIPYIVAILHTIFNLTNTCILIWFIPQIEKIVTLIVPSPKDGEAEVFRLKYIAGGPLGTAELSLNEAQQEIVHFSEICYKGFGYIREAVNAPTEDRFDEVNEKLVKYEEITDKIEYEIASYLNEVSKNDISAESARRIKKMYKIISEMESLGDSGEALGRLLKRKYAHHKEFTPDMMKKLNRMLDTVDNAYKAMMTNLCNEHLTDITNAVDAEYHINECRNILREEHIANLELDSYDYTSGVYYMDAVAELEKIGDFIINISEAKLGKSK